MADRPAYVAAAGIHSEASYRPDKDGGGILSSLANAPKFWGLALGSGAASIANSFIALGNMFTGNEISAGQWNMQKWLNEHDSDWAKYYRDNTESIDTWGFIASSLLPGTGGIKGLHLVQNLGQKAITAAATTGQMGRGLSWATGLLVPKAESYIAKAALKNAESTASFKLLQSDTLKVLGSKLHENVLEAAAFEAGVAATMHQSPFFDNMDTSDMVWNAGVGVLLGGAIGGAIGGVGAVSSIKKRIAALTKPADNLTHVNFMPEGTPRAVQVSYGFRNRGILQRFIDETDTTVAGPAGETPELVKRAVDKASSSISGLDNQLRTELRTANLESNLGMQNYFATKILSMDSTSASRLTLGVDNIARVAVIPAKREKEEIFGKLVVTGKYEDGWQFGKLYGTNTGWVTDAANLPAALPLADTVKVRARSTLQQEIDALMKNHGHKLGDVNFDVTKANAAPLEHVQTRYLKAAKGEFSFKLTKLGKDKKPLKPIRIFENDFPVLEALVGAVTKLGDATPARIVDILNSRGKIVAQINTRDLAAVRKFVEDSKIRAKDRLVEAGMAPDEIAERLNINPGYVTGMETYGDASKDLWYRQALADDLKLAKLEDVFYQPQWVGLKSNVAMAEDLAALTKKELALRIEGNPDILFEMQMDIEQMYEGYRKVAQEGIDRAVAAAGAQINLGTYSKVLDGLVEPEIVNQNVLDTSRLGPGGGLFTYMNGNYLSPEAIMQKIGFDKVQLDRHLIGKIDEEFKGVADTLVANPAAAVHYQAISELVASTGEKYIHTPGLLRSKKIAEWEAKLGEHPDLPMPTLKNNAPIEIPINHEATDRFIATHMRLNAERVRGIRGVRAAKGISSVLEPDVFYPVKPNPRDYNHFVLLRDKHIAGDGAMKMLHAATKSDLEQMVTKVRNSFGERFEVFTKQDTKEFHEAVGDYNWQDMIKEQYLDSELASKGINSQFLPITDPRKIVDQVRTWHQHQARGFNYELLATKYSQAFRELEARGREFSRLDSASYASLSQLATEGTDNPYVNYIKTALNVSRLQDYPALNKVSEFTDATISRLWNRVDAFWQQARHTPTTAELEMINNTFKESGFQTAYYDAATALLVNRGGSSQVASQFVSAVNSILATTFLRMDYINALNNKFGSIILTSSELRHLLNGVKTGNRETAGKLAQLSEVLIPGTTDTILSPTKLVSKALENFIKRPELMQEYKTRGFVTDVLIAARGLLDDATITGRESTSELSKRIRRMAEKATALQNTNRSTRYASTVLNPLRLNQWTEELNRFIAADIPRQIGELAVEAGIATPREVAVIQNTFVNRTQVNLLRNQRPMVFQGPIGMAMGLFQSYQFNLMQQLFRYIEPGQRKTAAMLAGMQSSIYGLNGLPGFQELNEYIIGQAAGNDRHNDMYSSIFRAAGAAAPWLIYGAPSNMLNVNLYVRGDLTPQHPTILPSSPLDFPVIAKTGQFFANLKQVLTNATGGVGIWESIVTGLEHNSVNRPLAGLAQVLRGVTNGGRVYGTDQGGNLLSGNDLLSLTTLARMAGGKPLDEAIARDEMWRTSVYRAADMAKKRQLGQELSRAFASGSQVDMEYFMENYLAAGGKQAGLNRWIMNQYTRATTSQAELARRNLNSPYSHRIQVISGGLDTEGFTLEGE